MSSSKVGKSGPKILSRFNKKNLAWAFYDWANSAFATTVMAGFFPLFLKQYWSTGATIGESSYYLGLGNSVASLLLAVSAPFLGALADLAQNKKKFLLFFATLGVLCTAGLYLVDQGQWPLAILFYVLSSFGFAGGNVFYDALLPSVAKRHELDFVSGLGYSMGYLGGGLLFTINVLMTLKPTWFGLNDAAEAVKYSFISVAIWWTLFSIPLFLFVPEARIKEKTPYLKLVKQGFVRLWLSLKNLRFHKEIMLFLVAYLFYIDGVNTIIKMAIDYGLALGFESTDLIVALLITQFVGFPAAIGFGFIGERFTAIKGIFFTLFIYIGISFWGYFLSNVLEFYAMAGLIGLVQGGIQSLSRSHFAMLIPVSQEAEFFGFFNMLGKFSAIVGPVLMGFVSMKTQNPRLSILVVVIFFIIGGVLLKLHKNQLNKI